MKHVSYILALLAALATTAFAQCTITPAQPAVGAGKTVTFVAHNCGTPNPGFSVVCHGSGCQTGSINATTGSYSGPTVSAPMFSRGCQVGPRDSVFDAPINAAAGIGVSAYNSNWMGRVQTDTNNLIFHTVSPGTISEFDNTVPDTAPRQKYYFYEGGFFWNGDEFLQPYPPYIETEAGYSMDVYPPHGAGGLDNHFFVFDTSNCEYDQVYKPYLDFQTFAFSAGSVTTVSFTTDTIRTIATPIHVWVYGTTGSCGSGLDNGNTGWFATVTQQPNLNSGSGQITIPFNSLSCSLAGSKITAINEGNGQGPTNDNAQSGAIYPLNSNALNGGSNAAGTEIIGIRPEELYSNVVNAVADPNDAGLVTGWHHAVVTTTSNLMLAPLPIWPATNNAYLDHPFVPVTAITEAGSAQITLQGTCNGSCITALNVCSGKPQFSSTWNNCASPSSQQFNVVFAGCTGNFTPLNGQHLTGTYVDSEDFTVPFNTSTFGSYPGGCTIYFDWPPYGARYRIKASFNCESICSSSSLTNKCPYEKAACRSLQTYGLIVTDGTLDSDTWNTEIISSEFNPDFIHDSFGVPDNNPGMLGTLINCTGGPAGGNNFSNCLEIVDESSLNVNGPADATTNNQRVTVTYVGTSGTASTDVIQQGTTVGCQNERMAVPAGGSYQLSCWLNGNVNTALTYAISPASGAGTVSSGGLYTPPAVGTTIIPATISACSSAVSSACDYVQVFAIPVAADGIIRIWPGGKDGGYSSCNGQQANYYTDSSGKVWYGAWTDPGYVRNWQTDYEIATGINFAGLFGTWTSNCSGWNGVQDGQLYGTSTSAVNDQLLSIALPNGTYQVSGLGEAGYNTSGTGQNVFDVEGGGSAGVAAEVLASNQDGWTLAGGAYRPYTIGPFTITVTDGVLHYGERIRTYNTSQYEGISLSAISITPVNIGLSIVSTSPLPNCTVNVACGDIISGSGGAPSYSWSIIAGSLPAGLSLCPGYGGLNCALSGSATVTGTFTFTVQLCGPAPTCVSKPFQLTVVAAPLIITLPVIMPAGTTGVGYSTTFTATGGVSPYTWSITNCTGPCAGGNIPGLSLVPSTGVESGAPTRPGTYGLTVQVTDSVGTQKQKTYNPIIIHQGSSVGSTTASGATAKGGSTAAR